MHIDEMYQQYAFYDQFLLLLLLLLFHNMHQPLPQYASDDDKITVLYTV